jgi:hypothetical protein
MSARWAFLSHHAQVFLCIARDPDARLRDVADEVRITERSVQSIVNDLVAAGYVTRSRLGRRNHYEVHANAPSLQPLPHDIDAGTLLRFAASPRRRRVSAERRARAAA